MWQSLGFRAALCGVLTACWACAQAAPFSVSVQTNGEWRTATPPAYDAQGVSYVSLSSLARQLGADFSESDGQCAMTFLGKRASLSVQSPHVASSVGPLALGHPILRYESDVLIASTDVNTYLEKAFGATVGSPAGGGQSLLQPPLQTPLQKPLQSSPAAAGGTENPNQMAAQLQGSVPGSSGAENPEAANLGASLESSPPANPAAPAEGETVPAEGEGIPVSAEGEPSAGLERASLARVLVIDPGHGGGDSGTAGGGGLMEKEVVLSLSQMLQQSLKSQAQLKVLTTRDDDRDVALRNRINFASVEKATLLLSLHTGASFSPKASGVEVFYPLPDGSSEGEPVSVAAAKAIAEKIASKLGVEPREPRGLPLLLFRGASISGVLVECGMLTNPAEESQLRTEAHLKQLAEGIAEGVAVAMPAQTPEGAQP